MRVSKSHYVNFNALVVCFCIMVSNMTTSALQVYWTGLSGDGNWNTPANWSPNNIPGINDTVYFNASAYNCTMNGDVFLTSLIFSPGYTGEFAMGHTAYISGDVDLSTGGTFFTTTYDSLYFTGNSLQNITGKPGVLCPVIVKEGTGALNVISAGIRAQALILKNGIFANSGAFNDTVGDFISTGGQLNLNSGSITINGVANFKGIQSFPDYSGNIYINGVVPQVLIPSPDAVLPAIHKISSYNLTIDSAHFRTKKLNITSGQVTIDTSYNIDSVYFNSSVTFISNISGTWSDTIHYFKGRGSFNTNNSSLYFTGDTLNCDSLTSFNQEISGSLVFAGGNQTFIPKNYSVLRKVCQRGTGTTTISKNGIKVDTLEIISGELNLGNLIDSIGCALKLTGGVLNFSNSILRVGTPVLNLNGGTTLIPADGHIEFSSIENHDFYPRSNEYSPAIDVFGATVHVRGNHLRASRVNLNSGTLEMDTTFSIDTLHLSSGVIFRSDSAAGNSDTISFILGNGTLELRNSELCFTGSDIDLTMNPNITGGTIAFIGPNKTFRPSSSFVYRKIVQKGSGVTTVTTHGFKVDSLEIISGEFNLGNGLIDSVSRSIKVSGGTLNFSNSTLGVGCDTVDLDGSGTILPGNGILNLGGYMNRVFIPNRGGVHPVINISGMTTYVRRNHLKAHGVNVINGTLELDSSFSIDSLNLSAGAILRCDSVSGNSDTVGCLLGNGTVELRKSELCFSHPIINMSTFTAITGGAISFIGSNQTFTPSTNFLYNKIRRKGSGITTITTSGLRVDTLEIVSGHLNLGYGLSDSVGSMVKMLGGTLNFGSSVLRTGSMNFDLTGPGTIVPSDGTIEFSSMGSQNFIPPDSGIMPKVNVTSDMLHIKGNRLRTSKLTINSGTVIMDTTFTVDTLNVNYGGALLLDTVVNQKDTAGAIFGNGTLNFGGTVLHISKDANFATFDTIIGSANLELDPVVNSLFSANSEFVFNKIKKNGNLTTTIGTNGLRVKNLSVNGGTLDWGTSYNDSILDTLFLKNAVMNLGNNPVMFRSLIDSNSVINFNNSRLERFGNSGIVDLGNAHNFTFYYQGFNFKGAPGATTKIIPSSTCRLPPILVDDSGFIEVTANFNSSSIDINRGNWNWGNNLSHMVRGISVQSGIMTFNNSVITMDSGNVNFGIDSDIRRGTSTIILSAKMGQQMIYSQTDSILPNILKTDTATLMMNSQLKCHSYKQTGGKTWFSGFGITADSSISFENVDSLIHLNGVTFQAGEMITFAGSAGKPLYCNPATQWFINVPGNLRADHVVLKNSVVTGTTGIAFGPSVDSGGNSNWLFRNDVFPPDNDLNLMLTAIDTGRIRISWNPSAIDSGDADSVGIRYSSSKMPDSINDLSTVLLGYFPLTRSFDTVVNLTAHTTYYFAAAVSDTSGNWSGFTAGASGSVRTKTIAPQLTAAPDTIHTPAFTLSWKNPPGLSYNDGVFIHITEIGNPSAKVYAKFSSTTTSATVVLPSKEAVYRYVLSTSHDSAGLFYTDDAYIDSVLLRIDPPVLHMSKDTFYSHNPVVSWSAPAGFSAADTFFVHTDTVSGAGWVQKAMYTSGTTAHTFLFSNAGTFKIMISTNWDKTGKISLDNVAIDTISVIPDTIPPRLSINFNKGTIVKTMPLEISGTAYDTISGLLSLSFLISKNKDTTYWNGASWQKSIFWIPLQKQLMWNYSTTGMSWNEGMYVIKIGATDSVGNIRYDTTYFLIDNSAPVITKVFENKDSKGSWNGLISGEAVDSISVIQQVLVSVKNDSGKFYDGSTWVSQEYLHTCDGTTSWSKQISRMHLVNGDYSVSIAGIDTAGNKSVTPVIKIYRYFSSSDSVNRIYNTDFHAAAVNCSTMTFYWNKQYSALSDSIVLALSKIRIPLSAEEGEYRYVRAINDTAFTVTNLPAYGAVIYAKLFFKEKSGASTVADSSAAIIKLPDCIAPENLVSTTISKYGDSLVTVHFKTDNKDAVQIVTGAGISRDAAVTNRFYINNRDTSITIRAIVPGTYYCAVATIDMSGNMSPFKFDSITINNSAPYLKALPDTSVTEGKVMTRQLFASDLNNDTIQFRLKNSNEGMSITNNVFRWTPRNSDVGLNTIIIECLDTRGAASFDTFTISVTNIAEPPVVTYDGPYEIYEDSSYSGTISIDDPDVNDSVKITIIKLPVWITMSKNKLTGVASNEYVGSHQIEMIFTDRDSLRDTLSFQIKVINTNDKPVIVSGALPDTLIEKVKNTIEIKITDDDDGDSVTIKNVISKSWIKINQVKKTDKAKEWAASVTLSPVQIDTGSHEVKLEITDRYGGKVIYSKKIRVIDADDPPGKPSLVRKTATGAVQYTVSATDDRDKLLMYSVKMRALVNDSIIYADSSVRLSYVFYPLADGKYQFSAVAVDGGGLKSTMAVDTAYIAGSSERVLKDTSWEMISIPSKSYAAANLKNTSFLLHWDESGIEKQVYSFYKRKDEISVIEPSMAYWRKGINNDTIRLSVSDFIKEPVVITLHKKESGWNQVSSPFPYPVTWSRKADILWKWNPKTNDYEEVQNVLEPWSGYWVRVDSATSVTVSPLPVFSTGSLAKLRKAFYLNKNNWMVQVSLRAPGGNDIDNKFGLNQNANDQFDEFDRPEPPAVDGRPVLYFKHDDWKKGAGTEFASDIRKSWKSVNIFEFALEGTQANVTGTLNFSGLENASDLYIFTKIGDSIFQVNQSETYSVPLSKDVSFQTVFVTDNAGFLNSFPLHFRMGNPYPNPFCPTTRINYTLPYRWERDGRINLNPYNVSIEIYDIMGRKLRTLVYRKMVPGNYSLMWDGKMENGRVVASGKYFCVLKADNFKQNKNLTLMK